MELVLSIIMWLLQIGCVLLLAALLTAGVVWGGEMLIRKKRGKFLPRFLIVLVLMCALLAAFAVSPPVACAEHCREQLTEQWRDTVRSVSGGLYSGKIPLVPVCVHVKEIEDFVMDGTKESLIEFDVYYFCFGKLGMEYSTYDGFNISKPVFRG